MYIREGIGLFLLLVGLLRASVLVTHDPVVGYAHQPDMQHIAACSNLVPDTGPRPAGEAAGPFAFFRTGDVVRADCYPSTEVALDGTVLAATRALQSEGRGIRIQWMGYAKLLLLAITAFFLAWALHEHPAASLAHGILFLAVLSDPVATLWLNTFASEFFVLWGIYTMVGALCALAIGERAGIVLWSMLVLASAALAFSREQFIFLPVLLIALGAAWTWYRSAPMTMVSFLVAVVVGMLSLLMLQRTPPPLSAAGEAPAAFALPRAIPLSPVAFGEQAAKGMASLQAIALDAGTLEGAKKTTVGELPWWAFSPLNAAASRESRELHRAIALATLLLAPLALLVAFAWARPASQNIGTPLLFGLLVGGTALYGFVTATFGAGTPTSRSFIPAALALWTLDLSVLIAAPFLVRRWAVMPKQSWKEMAIGLAGAVLYLGAFVLALDWMATRG